MSRRVLVSHCVYFVACQSSICYNLCSYFSFRSWSYCGEGPCDFLVFKTNIFSDCLSGYLLTIIMVMYFRLGIDTPSANTTLHFLWLSSDCLDNVFFTSSLFLSKRYYRFSLDGPIYSTGLEHHRYLYFRQISGSYIQHPLVHIYFILIANIKLFNTESIISLSSYLP